jgi:hypothetical protein
MSIRGAANAIGVTGGAISVTGGAIGGPANAIEEAPNAIAMQGEALPGKATQSAGIESAGVGSFTSQLRTAGPYSVKLDFAKPDFVNWLRELASRAELQPR